MMLCDVVLVEYLRIFKERWKLVLSALMLGLAIASLMTWLTTPTYAASVTFFVSARDTGDNAPNAYQGSLLSQQRVKSYAQLLASDRIRRDVEQRENITFEPETITASVSPDTVLLTATATDPSPEMAKRIADAVGAAFPRLVEELERPQGDAQPGVSVRVVEPAHLPSTPVGPHLPTNAILGAAIGLLCGFAAALIRNALDNSVKSAETLAECAEAPVLGTVPFASSVPTRPLIVHEPAGSPRAETHRRIRTNLQFVDVDQPPQVVVITSAVPGEGKTTTACNLAITLAEAGRTVALVGADLRRPRMADCLGIEGAVGLTSVLIDHATLDEALQPWGQQRIDVLANGPTPPNPSELLASRHMNDLLVELSGRYDYVLVDAPPLLPVTDAAVLASRCDGALLVVRYGRTTKNQVRAARAALNAVSARLLGAVLTMTPKASEREAYGHYHYSQRSDRDDGSPPEDEFDWPLLASADNPRTGQHIGRAMEDPNRRAQDAEPANTLAARNGQPSWRDDIP